MGFLMTIAVQAGRVLTAGGMQLLQGVLLKRSHCGHEEHLDDSGVLMPAPGQKVGELTISAGPCRLRKHTARAQN